MTAAATKQTPKRLEPRNRQRQTQIQTPEMQKVDGTQNLWLNVLNILEMILLTTVVPRVTVEMPTWQAPHNLQDRR